MLSYLSLQHPGSPPGLAFLLALRGLLDVNGERGWQLSLILSAFLKRLL